MKKRARNIILFSLIVLFILGWSVMLYFISPQEIVDYIGIRNGYSLSFLFGVFGEAATFTALSYYPAIITLAAGGLNPFLLGLIAGTGMTIGNSLYFILGESGRTVLSKKLEEKAHAVLKWVDKKPDWLVRILIFLYVGFTPFPNNLLTATGGVTGYPFKKIIIPLWAGNIVLTTSIAYLTSLGLRLM
jgi:membrane protein YqaA with SNARE-associated domain